MADVVTLAEVKDFLPIAHTDDDTMLAALITQITAAIEVFTRRSYSVLSTITEYLDGGGSSLMTSTFPITTLTSVTDNDNAVPVAMLAADYEFYDRRGVIYKSDGTSWGSGRRRWKVVYSGGMLPPPHVKLAALTWIADVWINRASLTQEGLGDHSFSGLAVPSRVQFILGAERALNI